MYKWEIFCLFIFLKLLLRCCDVVKYQWDLPYKIHFSDFFKIFKNCILKDSFFQEFKISPLISSIVDVMRHLYDYQLFTSAVTTIKIFTVDWIGAFVMVRDKRTISGCLRNFSEELSHRNVIFPRNNFFDTAKAPKNCFENGVDWSDLFFGENDRI